MQKHQKEREEAAAIKSRAREIVATSARGCGTAKATAMKNCGTANTLGNTKIRVGNFLTSEKGADTKHFQKMKITVLRTAVFIVLAVWSVSGFAQSKTKTIMYVMGNNKIFLHPLVSDAYDIVFDGSNINDGLIVHKNDDSPADTILLNDIQRLAFSEENLYVKTMEDNIVYAFEDIEKLRFASVGTVGIDEPSVQIDSEVFVYIAPTGEVIVESPVAIKSLTLFSTEGKMLSQQHCKVETQCVASLRDVAAGIYLLHVETVQGTVVKKIVKPLNK